jgi:hypothetical protein
MEKIVNVLEELLPYVLAWGGGIISVLLGAFFNHNFTQKREQRKWLIQSFFDSLKKCIFLLRQINHKHRHVIPLPSSEEIKSGNIMNSINSEEMEQGYISTVNPIDPDEDSKVIAEMCAEIETEIDFLIINGRLFGSMRSLLEDLKSNIEKSNSNNPHMIEKEYREKILKNLHEIGHALKNTLK